MIGAITSNEWQVTTRASSVITATWIFQGLWMNCGGTALGSFHCRPHLTLFKVEGYIQACRALMIAAVSLGFFGSIFALVGMKCTKIGGSDRTKDKIACSAGVTFILSGLSSLTGCSLYAHRITSEYFDPNFVSQKYEFGIALFIGWAGAVLCLIGGSIFCCSMAERSKIQRKRNPYTGASSTMSFQTKVNSAAANLISNQGIPKHFDKNAYV
ncbi:claudin-10 isoform X3 [Rhinatrema bivittatum]|nr:claudin-10 isoform X3 [Rhinatrema bivittatum]XP_029460593.1 claudin-10 isoform X3 [Rhinatrema bivittatum]XP_029460594.1 claudin-10 isoform X3 [Rhinatrema bivittatum]